MIKALIKRWCFFIGVIIYILLLAQKVATGFYYFFFWLLLIFVVFSFVMAAMGFFFARVSLRRNVSGKAEEDDFADTQIVVENRGIFPLFNLLIEDYVPYAAPPERLRKVLLQYLGPRSSVTFDYRIWCSRRGRYEIGPFFVYFYDPWGLFFFQKIYPIFSEKYVYPKTFPIQKFPPLAKGTAPWFGIQSNRVSGDEHDFYGIREYKPGDPIKKIHWMSTARQNKLIVKQFQQRLYYRVTILFNLEKNKNYGVGKESVVEYMVKIAASIAKHFLEKDVSVEFVGRAGEVVNMPFNKGPEHLEAIFRFLAEAQAESTVGLTDVFEEFSSRVPSDSSLVVIMLDQDWEALVPMLSIENRNIFLIPLILIASSFLNVSDKHEVIKSVKMMLPAEFSSPPIFFACGDRLDEPFLR
jgi:uncharacterized protein (DUF58 family)